MAGKRKEPTPAQRVLLNNVRTAHSATKNKKAEVEIRVREQVRREVEEAEFALGRAIRAAHDSGLSIGAITNDGLGNTNRAEVKKWLNRVPMLDASGQEVSLQTFTWADQPAGQVRVNFADFPSLAKAQPDYPAILEGVAERDATVRGGWKPVTDPGTVETDGRQLPGWFSYELGDFDAIMREGSLSSMLTEWAEANR